MRGIFTLLCAEASLLDPKCFWNKVNPKGKKHASIWEKQATHEHGTLKEYEFIWFYAAMDRNRDGVIKRREAIRWYKRNEHLLCRPYRKDIVLHLRARESSKKNQLFTFLDANHDSRINGQDLAYSIS